MLQISVESTFWLNTDFQMQQMGYTPNGDDIEK
jgi:hypothetical protein